MGWTGTELEGTEAVVKIPSGSKGAREYTAVWKKEDKMPDPSPSELTEKPEKTEENLTVYKKPKGTNRPEKERTASTQAEQNPKTGSDILWMYVSAILSVFCMMILTIFYKKCKRQQSSVEAEGGREADHTACGLFCAYAEKRADCLLYLPDIEYRDIPVSDFSKSKGRFFPVVLTGIIGRGRSPQRAGRCIFRV